MLEKLVKDKPTKMQQIGATIIGLLILLLVISW